MNTNTSTEQDSQRELMNTQMNVPKEENNLPSGKIIQLHHSDEHPFTIVEVANGTDENHFIAMKTTRISDMMTKEACEKKLKDKDWDLITTMVVTITEMVIAEIQEEDKKIVNDQYRDDQYREKKPKINKE